MGENHHWRLGCSKSTQLMLSDWQFGGERGLNGEESVEGFPRELPVVLLHSRGYSRFLGRLKILVSVVSGRSLDFRSRLLCKFLGNNLPVGILRGRLLCKLDGGGPQVNFEVWGWD